MTAARGRAHADELFDLGNAALEIRCCVKQVIDSAQDIDGSALAHRVARPFDQIPQVAVQILEHRDRAVALDTWWTYKLNATLYHAVVVPPEIVGRQKEGDAATGLVADEVFLHGVRWAGEQERGARRSRWRDDHPALLLFRHKPVLDEREVERPRKERNRFVVVANDQRNV